MIRRLLLVLPVTLLLLGPTLEQAYAAEPHNVILFVPDGLRALMVTPEQAPTMAALASQGVRFSNSHSLFPTFTTPNASGLATGHYLGDSGDFANVLYSGFEVPGAGMSVTPFIENDQVLGELDSHFAGNFLNETTIIEAAHAKGYNTAVVGKLGPTLIFSHTERDGLQNIIIDDATGHDDENGHPKGVALAPWLSAALTAKALPLAAPGRGENGKAGNGFTPGTLTANDKQEDYFTAIATDILLPKFKQDQKPFLLVYWSRDPDGSQHNEGDSLNQLVPGINGLTALAGIRNADSQLAKLRAALEANGLAATTDIIVAADHGFSVISKQSETSSAARASYPDVQEGFLPPGFLALDLSVALGMKLFDPDNHNQPVEASHHSRGSNGLLGKDASHPEIVIAANGGSDLIYLPGKDDKSKRLLAGRIITALLRQDFVSGLFVDPKLGSFKGALPLSAINLAGEARTPRPAIVVSFASHSTGCDQPSNCVAEIADSTLQQGQGMHGSFARGDVFSFTAAFGPDFKSGFIDSAPVSNADIGQTIAKILGLKLANKGKLTGRVIEEAMQGGVMPQVKTQILRSPPNGDGLATVLKLETVGDQRYFDAAGFVGRTVGLEDVPPSP